MKRYSISYTLPLPCYWYLYTDKNNRQNDSCNKKIGLLITGKGRIYLQVFCMYCQENEYTMPFASCRATIIKSASWKN